MQEIWVVLNHGDIIGYCNSEGVAILTIRAYELQDMANGLNSDYSIQRVEAL